MQKHRIITDRRTFLAGVTAFGIIPSVSFGDDGRPYNVTFEIKIPTRDGTQLSATLVRPPGPVKPLPVVLTLTPYQRDYYFWISRYFATHGYAGIAVDVRGRGDSEGHFEPYVNDGRDGYDVVEWLAKQPFCDGRVVMRGNSYTGLVQMTVAALRPPALKTIIPGAAPWQGFRGPTRQGIEDPYELRWYASVSGRGRNIALNRDDEYWYGLYRELASGKIAYKDFAREAGLSSEYWDKLIKHPVLDDFWKTVNPTPDQLSAVDIPILTLTGSYDGAERSALFGYERILESSPSQRSRNYLMIGPWDHEGVSQAQTEVGGVKFGTAAKVNPPEVALGWFNWVLGNGPKPSYLKDRVTYYVIGENSWRGTRELDMPNPTVFQLNGINSGGVGLLGQPVDSQSSPDRTSFTYDPTKPAVSWEPMVGDLVSKEFLRDDPILKLMGTQGLVFETDPFIRVRTLAGRPNLVLNAAISTPDTDFVAMIYEVEPNGSTTTLGYDVMRARYRNGLDRPKLVTPGEFLDYRFQLTWMGRRIEAGRRLRIVITSPGIAFTFLPNRNTGGDPAFETIEQSKICRITIRYAGRSYLTVPLLS